MEFFKKTNKQWRILFRFNSQKLFGYPKKGDPFNIGRGGFPTQIQPILICIPNDHAVWKNARDYDIEKDLDFLMGQSIEKSIQVGGYIEPSYLDKLKSMRLTKVEVHRFTTAIQKRKQDRHLRTTCSQCSYQGRKCKVKNHRFRKHGLTDWADGETSMTLCTLSLSIIFSNFLIN